MHAHPTPLVPPGHKASALSIAEEIRLQPPRQPVLAAGMDQPAGDQHEGSIRPWDHGPLSQKPIQQIPQSQLLEQRAHHQQRPPAEGLKDVDIAVPLAFHFGGAFQDTAQVGQYGGKQIATAQVGDDALLDLAVFAVGLDDAQVFIEGTVGGGDFDGAHVHAV